MVVAQFLLNLYCSKFWNSILSWIVHVNQKIISSWTFEKSTIHENWPQRNLVISLYIWLSEPDLLHSVSMTHVRVHKTFRVFALYFRVTLQVEGLVIKRSVAEVLMEMRCLDVQCDKHQVFHIQVSCLLTGIYHATVGVNWILIPKIIL